MAFTPKKHCPRCKNEKPHAEFYGDVSKKGGLSSYCRECAKRRHREEREKRGDEIRAWRREYQNQWTAANRDRTRHYKFKARYGITPAEFEQMLEAQGGVCAICGQPERTLNAQGRIRPLSVDHDHETDAVRGLLCMTCNQGLGALRDDPGLLEAGAKYLRKAKQ